MRETPEDWERREKDFEDAGFKGGQGRSNRSVYESSEILFICGVLFMASLALFAVSSFMQWLMGR